MTTIHSDKAGIFTRFFALEKIGSWVFVWTILFPFYGTSSYAQPPTRITIKNNDTCQVIDALDSFEKLLFFPMNKHQLLEKFQCVANESLPLNPGEYAWLSFPRLTRTANNAVPVNDVLFDNIDPEDYESQSELVNLPPTLDNEISNVFSGTQWPSNAYLTHIQSTLGYKLKLLYNYTPEKKQVQLHGNVLSQDEPLNIYKDHDNWVGYWLYTSQSPFDAFPENVLDELTVIKAQTWCCVKRWELADGMLTPHWLCAVHKDKVALDYGDMVILETNNDLSFKWQNTGIPFTKESKMDAQYYSFTEEADYISFFIELDSTENPKEVGAFIGETCIGATTVWPEDTVVLVPGYAEGMSGEVVFKEYYDDFKSANAIKSEYLVADNTNGNWNRRTIHTHENQGHYFISFGSEAENLQTTDDFQITIYPNPANNWLYINYRLDEPSNIEIQVIDGFGRQVATLLNNTQTKGDYAMQWNLTDAQGKKLTTGIYVLNIKESGRVVTKKLVIY